MRSVDADSAAVASRQVGPCSHRCSRWAGARAAGSALARSRRSWTTLRRCHRDVPFLCHFERAVTITDSVRSPNRALLAMHRDGRHRVQTRQLRRREPRAPARQRRALFSVALDGHRIWTSRPPCSLPTTRTGPRRRSGLPVQRARGRRHLAGGARAAPGPRTDADLRHRRPQLSWSCCSAQPAVESRPLLVTVVDRIRIGHGPACVLSVRTAPRVRRKGSSGRR